MSFLENKTLKTNAINLFLLAITGEQAQVISHPEYNQIILTANQKVIARDFLDKMLSADPGNVRMDIKPIITPIVLKNFWPWLVGAGAGALGLGALLKK